MSFYCDLCQKGYARMNEYESHLSSYDHSHKQRLKDMKAMVRDPNAAARARKQEAKADGVVSIKLQGDGGPGNAAGGGGGGGFKKGGFKKSGFKPAFVPVSNNETSDAVATPSEVGSEAASRTLVSETAPARDAAPEESDSDEYDYEVYDPRRPTD